jgi:tripartite-type tricarboxylate transporter receptor subunit TctC
MVLRLLSILFCVLFAAPLGAAAQDFPTRMVKIIVPYPPAGASDIVARLVANQLQEMWKQPVVIENRQGAGGNIGAGLVAFAEPDGYTLLVAMQNEVAVNQHLYTNMPYEPLKAFAPVTLAATTPLVLAISPTAPGRTAKELIDYARANPGLLTYASAGLGGFPHLAGARFAKRAGVDLLHIPFRGTGPGVTALLGGHVKLMFSGIGPFMPSFQEKTLLPVLVTSAKRSPALPDVPTVVEAGYPDLELYLWVGVFAPAKTPPAVLAKLNADIVRALRQPSVVAALKTQAFDVAANSPEEFRKFWIDQIELSGQIIKELGLEGSN